MLKPSNLTQSTPTPIQLNPIYSYSHPIKPNINYYTHPTKPNLLLLPSIITQSTPTPIHLKLNPVYSNFIIFFTKTLWSDLSTSIIYSRLLIIKNFDSTVFQETLHSKIEMTESFQNPFYSKIIIII